MKYLRFAPHVVLLVLFGLAATVTTAVQFENRDASCAACHTEPEKTFFARAQAEPSDLASAHAGYEVQVRCIDCHSGAGVAGRAGSLQQGATDLVAFVVGNYEQPAATTNPVGDAGCVKCHAPPTVNGLADSGLALKSKSHYHLAEYIAAWLAVNPDPRGACAICHTSHSEGARAAQQWSPRPAVNAACDACHTDLDDWTPPAAARN